MAMPILTRHVRSIIEKGGGTILHLAWTNQPTLRDVHLAEQIQVVFQTEPELGLLHREEGHCLRESGMRSTDAAARGIRQTLATSGAFVVVSMQRLSSSDCWEPVADGEIE